MLFRSGLLSTDTKLIANVDIDPTKNQGNEDVVGEGVVLLLDSILPYKSLPLDIKANSLSSEVLSTLSIQEGHEKKNLFLKEKRGR